VVLAIAGAQPTRQTLLAQLLRCIDLPSENLAPAEMQRLLAVFMREQLARGRRVVVQVDDADLMPPAACDELLRLAALARSGTFGAELVFSLVHIDQASSAAADFVRGHDALCVVVLARLKPNEVRWYINWRLQRFGLGGILTDDAVQFIGRSTDGCFAAVDHICQMSLLLLRNRTAERADAALVREAMRLLRRQLQRRQLPARESADAEAELIVSLNGTLLHRMVVGERILLGRSQLNDISLDSAYLSRHHLAIQRRGSGYFSQRPEEHQRRLPERPACTFGADRQWRCDEHRPLPPQAHHRRRTIRIAG
jgi:hypothetical protein